MPGFWPMIASLMAWLLVGCTAVLDIEERKLDLRELTEQGYAGCEPSNNICDACTSEWHTCICEGWRRYDTERELRARCASSAPEEIRAEQTETYPIEEFEGPGEPTNPVDPEPTNPPFGPEFCDSNLDTCGTCFCDRCGDQVAECASDDPCTEIMNCMMQSECDPTLDQGPGSCAEGDECGGVVSDHGGFDAPAYQLFRAAVKCASDEGCPCGDSPEPGPVNCSPDNGCACGTCWERCFCEGNDEAACRQQCGNPNCTAELGCFECADCIDACLCEGAGDPAFCTQACGSGPGSQPPVCDPANSCTDCQTCVGQCACEGVVPYHECLTGCGVVSCADETCGNCDSCVTNCACEGGSPLECQRQCVTSDCFMTFETECDQCACDRCSYEFAACEEAVGCPLLMDCIARTGCTSLSDCNQPELCEIEIREAGGIDSPIVGVAEALQSCRYFSCPCGAAFPGEPVPSPVGAPQTITCGTDVCDPYLPPPPETILSACCVGTDELRCGLDTVPMFGPDAICAALSQDGVIDDQCPDFQPGVPPWMDNQVLEGCCRPDGSCGYYDAELGLGCAPARAFGLGEDNRCVYPAD